MEAGSHIQNARKKYIGQTGSSFCMRYNEHLQSFKYRNSNSTLAKHLHDTRHLFDPTEPVMDALHFVKKGNFTNSLQIFISVLRQ